MSGIEARSRNGQQEVRKPGGQSEFRCQFGEEDEARQQDEDAGRHESGGVECHGAVLERSAPGDEDSASRSPAV